MRKFVSVTNRTDKDVTLFRVDMFDWTIPAVWPLGYPHSYEPNGFTDIHFHRAGNWYHNPINLFLRDDVGGWFVGVENPIFDARFRCLRKVYPTTLKVGFSPRWVLKPGETFDADPGFLGVYRQEKIYRVRPARAYFEGRERTPFEILDWGEVWAMQRYMDSIMPVFDAQGGHYPMSYWGYADPGRLAKISRKQRNRESLSTEEAAMLKHFGGAPFDLHDQELWYRLTPQTVKFYKQAVDDAAALGHYDTLVIPNMMAGHTGWFISEEQKKAQASVDAINDEWFERPAYPLWKEVSDYAASNGLGMFTLEVTSRLHRADKPEWGYLKADGRRISTRCYANTSYVDWYTDRIVQALFTHPIRCWQWDEGWMGSVEGLLGQDGECYATDHGHLPGNVHYQQFRSVMSTLERLKQKHPRVRMVIISGLIPGMPWVMKYLDGDSHTGSFEHAAWFDHNDLFLPSLKSHREGGIHRLIGRGSASVEPVDTTDWYTMLENPERFAAYRKHWDRWMQWTNAHLDFLRVRRDLFVPGDASKGLEGTAHCLRDRGFIFLHNAGKGPVVARIGLDRSLGLERAGRFSLTQLHPDERNLGVYPYAHELTLLIDPGHTKVLELKATINDLVDHLPQAPPGLPTCKAFLCLDDATNLIEPTDLWPATPLPGKANMPGF